MTENKRPKTIARVRLGTTDGCFQPIVTKRSPTRGTRKNKPADRWFIHIHSTAGSAQLNEIKASKNLRKAAQIRLFSFDGTPPSGS
ncbi:MAG TPA: hypothetical protein VG273_23440 [Bryobacteraceae bacterium]|jgi:hypothetical protein|nr:hypothetical protein [Bryobacteraceae bacterium]